MQREKSIRLRGLSGRRQSDFRDLMRNISVREREDYSLSMIYRETSLGGHFLVNLGNRCLVH